MTELRGNRRGELRPQLKRILEAERLDDSQFGELRQLLNTAESRVVASRWRWTWPASVAAALLLVLGVWFTGQTGGSVIPSRIAEEVTTNHIHLHPLDIRTSSMRRVREELDRLNFVPVVPFTANREHLTLQGARYCTLQGVIATQLMFEDEDGALTTYYQAAYDPERFGRLPDIERRQPLTLVKQGVEVLIWVEHGVVMAQASSSSATPMKDPPAM